MGGLGPYLALGLLAAALSFVLTPAIRWFSVRIGAIDHPSDRKVHALPTPTLGGAAIFASVLLTGAVAALLPQFRGGFLQSSEALGIGAGSVVIFALGVADDLHPLPAPVKLSGQVFAAGVLFLAGVRMENVPFLGQEFFSLSADVSALVTVLWLVAMMNAVNLVDGLDGLAAGIAAIASAAFFVYSFHLSQIQPLFLATTAPIVTIIVVGAALGFLRYNFHPASIFMGDSGSMLLGLLIGGATVVGVGQAPSASQLPSSSAVLFYFPLLIPLTVLAIPLLDAAFAIVRRARRRRSIFHADKEHLHHRLMDLGHGHRQAVIVMYVWSALAAAAGLGFTFMRDVVFALPVAVGAIVLYTLFPVLTKAIQDRLSP